MKIDTNSIVSIHYTLTNSEGAVLDTSSGKAPLVYFHGKGNIIPGLENALVGKAQGDSFKVEIPPEQAYGAVRQEMVQTVPLSAFEGIGQTLEPGMQFQAQSPDGQARLITVVSVDDQGVKVDGNHPLAGEVLHFDVSVEDIRDATAEEMERGSIQG